MNLDWCLRIASDLSGLFTTTALRGISVPIGISTWGRVPLRQQWNNHWWLIWIVFWGDMQNYALCAVLTMYYEALCARSYVALCSPYFKDSSGSIDKTNSQYNPNSLVQYALYTLPQLSKMPKFLWRNSSLPPSQLSQNTSFHVSSSPGWKWAGQQQFSSEVKM